jgi:hypothetical protein
MDAAAIAMGMFTACNTVRVFAYVPQILRIGRDPHGALAISYCTWGLFTISHLSTVAYALVAVQDWKMALVFLANTACCVAILGLTFFKRVRYRQKHASRESVDEAPSINRPAPIYVTRNIGSRGFEAKVIANPGFRRSKVAVPLIDEWRYRQRAS